MCFYFINKGFFLVLTKFTKIFLFLLFSTYCFAHGMSESEKQIILEGGNLHFIYIGAVHMFFGYDHLLFVLGVIFLLKSFKDILKYVTAFTLGHSITLIIATFNSIAINYYLIDAIIALSVCFIGYVNIKILKNQFTYSSNMILMIFGLGLIHGLGLSTRLQQLQLNSDDLLLNILSFNLGIELGQIIALVIMLFFINILRKSKNFKAFSFSINIFIIIAGIYFFIVQVYEYKNSLNIQSEQVLNNWDEEIKIIIPANGDKEYKFRIEKDKEIEFSWSVSNKVNLYYDYHGDPDGAVNGYFQSYKESTQSSDNGQLIAPFSGIHGWYWKNETAFDVIITLKVKGDYKRLDL